MASTKLQRPNRYITFDPQTFDTLQRITEATGLSTSHIVEQLLNAHMPELYEYADWIERKGGETWDRGVHALASYGPHTLTTKMQHLDPTYQPPEVRFATALSPAEVEGLRVMLAERQGQK